MTGKEALLDLYNSDKDACGTEESYNIVLSELERLERIDKVMHSPIIEIVKEQEILSILRKALVKVGYNNLYEFDVKKLNISETIMLVRYLDNDDK